MTAVADADAGVAPLRVHVRAPDTAVRDRLVNALRRSGIAVTGAVRGRGGVVVAAGGSVDEAVGECPSGWWLRDVRPVVVADTFCPEQTRRAIRLGVRVMIPAGRATSANIAAAVHTAHEGGGRLPQEVLRGLLRPPVVACGATPLTPRQTTVLTLMADGYGNGAIAESLSCSEHTVKNVVYELMSRLQVRNRAHAVAHAVRAGLV